jgi:F0F1-type ATP synthase membrane subunit c/vacuolar-type H+-ATPase subunit K
MTEMRGDMPQVESSRANLQTLKLIWLALLFCLGIYALLPPLLRLPQSDTVAQFQAVLFVALGAVAIVTVVAVLMIRRLGLVGPLARGELDPDTPEGRSRAFLVTVITWALSESVALYGVVLYLLFHDAVHLYPFLLLALGLLLLQAPRETTFSGGRRPSDLARPDVKIG